MAELEKTYPDRKKFVDVKLEFSRASRLYAYWNRRGFAKYYKEITNSKHVLKAEFFMYQPEEIFCKEFHVNNVEFGNWLNIEWRYNYIFSNIVAFLDLNYVLKFPKNNIGLDVLNMAYGARGAGKALAHYEPHRNIINITRFHRKDKAGYKGTPSSEELNTALFLSSGGMGALSHEYGHFLDKNYGKFVNQESATFWRSITLDYKPGELENKPENYGHIIVNTLVNDEKGNRRKWFANMYEKLKGDLGQGSYWYRPTELFARGFEVYCMNKLKGMNVKNKLLTAPKYDSFVYPDSETMKKVTPWYDKFLKVYRENLNKK